ncbi:hypothetical protein E2C01_091020 [Portunus trituberculatus]|uniref:Uncharacterized protein n=1 Tax=Portunus trituberculatus TaxID=210409 RepID=A0A5B7JTY8_PORTR|nr:hypothetical protein [Portunus trituberculatus]
MCNLVSLLNKDVIQEVTTSLHSPGPPSSFPSCLPASLPPSLSSPFLHDPQDLSQQKQRTLNLGYCPLKQKLQYPYFLCQSFLGHRDSWLPSEPLRQERKHLSLLRCAEELITLPDQVRYEGAGTQGRGNVVDEWRCMARPWRM